MIVRKAIVKKEPVVETAISPEEQAVLDRLKEFAKRYKSAAWKSNYKRR